MHSINTPTCLILKFNGRNISEIIESNSNRILKTFGPPLTSKKPKLYLIKDRDEFVYVGITQQSLRNRFRYGFNADGESGYHGYKWKEKSLIQLYVWCFDELTPYQLEGVEAELVYLIRTKTGMWPIYQNEIHFNNDYDKAKEIAKSIYAYVEEKT